MSSVDKALADTSIEDDKKKPEFPKLKDEVPKIERPVWKTFKNSEMAKQFDQFIAKLFNLTLFRNEPKKMEEKDVSNLGGCVLFCFAYYSPAVAAVGDSPIAVVLMCAFGFIVALSKKMSDNEAAKKSGAREPDGLGGVKQPF